jgi:chemotaxis protein methyltransferase CheR
VSPRPSVPDDPDRANDAVLERIRRSVLEARGLDLSHYKGSFVRRRLAVRQRALGVERLSRYAPRLESDPAEMELLIHALTVNVSEFFRNPEVFRLLERTVLGELLARSRREGRTLRCWSAGCATGEEAYSVAILLERSGTGGESATVLGTDIDRKAVAAARAGVFDEARLREVDRRTLKTYFEPGPTPRTLRVRQDRLPPVRFQVRDVMGPSVQRDVDLLLCRNLLIYVDPDLQERLLGLLARALRPGGILVLGRVERLLGQVRQEFEALDPSERIYRKLASGATHEN